MNLNVYATIISYVNGKAICEDEFGDLWYTEMPESCAVLGTVVEVSALKSFDSLSDERRIDILREIEAVLDVDEVK